MPKLIDVFKKISAQINSNEVSAALGASEPWSVEISEEEFNKASDQIGSLMTLDAAVNNNQVYNQLKGKIEIDKEGELKNSQKKSMYESLEGKLSELGTHFNMDLKGQRLDAQLESLKGIQLSKGNDNALSQEITDLHKTIATRDQTIIDNGTKSASKLDAYKIRSTIRQKFDKIPIQKDYQKDLVKNGIFDSLLSELSNKASIKMDENDNIRLFSKDNPDIELFGENNQKTGIDDLINPLMQPYIQATPTGGEPSQTKTITTTDNAGLPEGMHPNSNLGSMLGQGNLM